MVENPSLLRAVHWYSPASLGVSGLMVNVERLIAPSMLLLMITLLPEELEGGGVRRKRRDSYTNLYAMNT